MREKVAKGFFYMHIESDLTGDSIAEMIGVTRQTIVNWETGVTPISEIQENRIMNIFKVPRELIYAETEDTERIDFRSNARVSRFIFDFIKLTHEEKIEALSGLKFGLNNHSAEWRWINMIKVDLESK